MENEGFPPFCGCSSMVEQKLPKLRTSTEICGFERQPGQFSPQLNQIDSFGLSTKITSISLQTERAGKLRQQLPALHSEG